MHTIASPIDKGPHVEDLQYSDKLIRRILRNTRTIAVVGASAKWNRPSYFAMKYMQSKGFRIIPVNPREAGDQILEETCYAELAEVPEKCEMVDIFRNSEAAGPITDAAIEHGAKIVWMQLGIRNDQAAAKAEAAGLTVIMNRCPKIEYSRLFSELGWAGVSTGVISSKRPKNTRIITGKGRRIPKP